MNRYKSGGPSKATAATLCQKCLKKGHYSYECNAAQSERPYTTRPSRTQQLLNPKLVPKIVGLEASPPKHQVTDAMHDLSKSDAVNHSAGPRDSRKERSHSASSYSSDSVSTISTNRSRSRPKENFSSGSRQRESGQSRQHPTISKYRPARESRHSRSATRSRSPDLDRLRKSRARSRSSSPVSQAGKPYRQRGRDQSKSYGRSDRSPMRKPSLSPFSARQALTRAMNNRN